MKNYRVVALVIGIALCATVCGQIVDGGKKGPGPNAKASSTGGGNSDHPLQYHDSPIVVSDTYSRSATMAPEPSDPKNNAVSITLDTSLFADLAERVADNSRRWNLVLQANPRRALDGGILSHSHGACAVAPQRSAPISASSNCANGCPGQSVHSLLVAGRTGTREIRLYDCDSIRIFLQTSRGNTEWTTPIDPQITISLEYVAQFGHEGASAQVHVLPPPASDGLKRQSASAVGGLSSEPGNSQQLAWVIRNQPRILLPTQRPVQSAAKDYRPKFQTAAGYRLQRVEVWGPNSNEP
ncbi:MAG: hypothetical protein ABI806_25395, partial [Candidatus Solibacter sp.]